MYVYNNTFDSHFVDNYTMNSTDTGKLEPSQLASKKPSTRVVTGETINSTTVLGSMDDGGNHTPNRIDSSGRDNVTENLEDSLVVDPEEDEDLQHILDGLIRHEGNHVNSNESLSYLDMGMFPKNSDEIDEHKYFDEHIKIYKGDDMNLFNARLKQFFIFSSAGKPIYSLHGTEDSIIGYGGLITTIMSSFQSNYDEDIKSIDYGNDLRIVVMNKYPLVFVTVTRISYELISDKSIGVDQKQPPSVLVNQLTLLYKYILLILSKPVITKYYSNRMNYDLRKVLTPLDYSNFDAIAMKCTYGLSVEYNESNYEFEFFMSELLENALPSTKIRYTVRSKLNNILLQMKNLKDKEIGGELKLFFNFNDNNNTDALGYDLLFSLTSINSDKIIGYLKPKSHDLTNGDLKLLLSIINQNENSLKKGEDLWIPICLPDFNPNGFLYLFVRTIDISRFLRMDGIDTHDQTINIILVCTNKNSFYKMQEICQYLLDKIIEEDSFRKDLYEEMCSTIVSTKMFPVDSMIHFVYKNKKNNQMICADLNHVDIKSSMNINRNLQLIYYYTNLYNTKSTTIKSLTDDNDKKISYIKWNFDSPVVGLMISDNTYEFYCLNVPVSASKLINDSLIVIKWCQKYNKRLLLNAILW